MSKIAFVTGGSRGIGAAIVRRLAKDGATVAFTYQSSGAAADALASEITAAGGTAVALQVDAADAGATRAAIDGIAKRFGRIDILVNNAGVLHLGDISELSMEAFDHTIAVNVRGVFAATQAAVAHMPSGGRVINIGSTNAERMPFPTGSIYAMSKSALTGLVQGLARDLGPRGITVNNVQPGPVDTDMNPAQSDFAKGLHELMAIKRHACSEEIAGMVAYLASEEAAYVTGAGLNIDGGFAA